ncbi:hypothetical protein [Marinicrinis sediminis]|uniref:Uncharacterized protein n=1 Tax=Marinicrinis sediminis TaxID=1652465 RepID=A0ABW5REL8_9BACL
MLSLTAAYHPFVSAALNYIRQVYHIPMEMKHTCFPPLFALHAGDGGLSINAPKELLKTCLKPMNGKIEFARFHDYMEAMEFAEWHVREQGPLPVQINRRHHPLDPTPFDIDADQLWMLIEKNGEDQYRFYDPLIEDIMEISGHQLRKAMDTPINYDGANGFQPFMTVEFTHAEAAGEAFRTHYSNEALIQKWTQQPYPLEDNLKAVTMFTEELRSRQKRVHTLKERYGLLESFQIIRASRECIDQHVNGMSTNKQAQERFPLWATNASRCSAYLLSYSEELLQALDEGLRRAVLVECRWIEHISERYTKYQRYQEYV